MTAIAPAPTPQPHTGDIPPGAHPPTSADILRAAGDMGIGTSAATSFAASLQGLAGQARSKGQELAASLEQHAASIQTMLHKSSRYACRTLEILGRESLSKRIRPARKKA